MLKRFVISFFYGQYMQNLFFIVSLFTGTVVSVGQERFKGYYEPFIKLEYDVTDNYSHEFAVEERTMWFEKESFKIEVKQIDLSHFSTVALNDKNALAVGIQYRFEENFVADEKNELRFTEEYSYTIQPKAIEFEHRLRTEQRITSSLTMHRFRYKFAVTRALIGPTIESGEAYIIGDIETLLTLVDSDKPKYEQRMGGGVGFVLNDFIKLELVTEYRLADFTEDLGHELFLVTGINFSI